MTATSSAASTSSRLREILFLCLVSVLPFWLFSLSAISELEGERQRIREENTFRMEDEHRELLSDDAAGILWHYFPPMIGRSRGSPTPLETLKTEMEQVKTQFPGCFEVVYFDSRGRVIGSDSDRPEAHAILEEFARDHQRLASTDIDEFNRILPKYRGTLGPCLSAYRAHQVGSKTSLAFFTPKRAIIGIFGTFTESPSFIYWFTPPPENTIVESAYRFYLFRKRHLAGEYLQGVVDLDQTPDSWKAVFGEAADQLPLIMGRPETERWEPIFLGGYQWRFFPITPKRRLVLALRDEAELFFRQGQIKLWTGLCIGILGIFFFRFGLFRQRFEDFSLQSKLLLLFLYTGGIPVLLLLISAQGMFHERQETMEKRIFQTHVEAIDDLDRTYHEYLGLIEEAAKRTARKKWQLSPDLHEKVTACFQGLSQRVRANLGFIFDRKGKELFQFGDQKSTSLLQKISPFFGLQVAKRAIEIEQLDVSPQESAKEQAIRATAESMGIDIDEMSSSRERLPGAFVSTKFGSENPSQNIDVRFRDVHGTAQAIGALFWEGKDLATLFLKTRPLLFMRKWRNITFGFHAPYRLNHHPHPFPAEFWEKLTNFVLKNSTLAVQQKVVREGKTFYVTAKIGKEVDCPFFALSGDEAVKTEIRTIAYRLAGTAFLALCLGIGVALMIYQNILAPIDRIGQGIAAMQQRRFDHRVPVQSTDEFGQVGTAFNTMMEGMADLEIAKVVQDTFFPQTPLKENGWEVFGSSVSASKVGGDYFDYFALKDGRWLILIGDVAGHGVAASLVVAMAKALSHHNAEKGSPAAIFEAMNLSLLKTLEKRRFMTCFLAIFDPRTGQFTSSNAGHGYPFLVRGEETREIPGVGTFLGTKQRRPFQEQTRTLEPEDVVVFYTDGLIEALDREGLQIGYDRVRQYLPALIRPDAGSTSLAIRRRFEEISASGPLADDVTVMVLQKSPGVGPETKTRT